VESIQKNIKLSYFKNTIMKPTFLIAVLSILSLSFFSCKKDRQEVDVKSLIIGNWKLTKYKQENENWKDSTGTFYKFVSDTLVNTKIRTFECDRKYTIEASQEGLKRISIGANFGCSFIYWYSFSIVSIDNNSMEITYPDEVGGVILRKNEKYLRE
jgi:hypothetical protein